MSADPVEADDLEPIVILDDEAAPAASEPSAPALSANAQAYLSSQGIEPATWAAFRLGQVTDADLRRLLTWTQRRQLRPGGIWLPTIDPRQPAMVAGLVRMTAPAHRHVLIGTPAGIAAPLDISDQPRVVLVDNPILGMRLHVLGVAGVAIVEDPAVLLPLADWLQARAVVTITTSKTRDMPLPPGVVAASAGRMAGRPERASDAALALVGLDPAAVRVRTVKQDLTPLHLRDLIDFARGRLGAGEAAQLLEELGAHHPALVQTYRIGFLPADFRGALHPDMRAALLGERIAGGLILPAFDDLGVAVDALMLCHRKRQGFAAEPLGLLAPEISRSYAEIIVTDTVTWLARLFRDGYANVQLLRGPVDAERNAARLAAAGVRQVTLRARRNRERIAAALTAAGIAVSIVAEPVTDDTPWDEEPAPVTVEPASVAVVPAAAPAVSAAPEPPPVASPPVAPVSAPAPAAVPMTDTALRLVEEDRATGILIYAIGPAQYAVDTRDDGDTRRTVTARCNGQTHRDRFDLASAPQRQRFASGAARRIGIPVGAIDRHLVAVFDAVRAHEDAALVVPAQAVDPTARAAVEALLGQADLLDRIAADLTDLGWVGEDRAKRLLYLTAVSRLLPRPLWSVYQGTTGAAPWQGLSLIGALTPPEDRIVVHRVTDALLARTDARALRHTLLIIDQAETLRPEAALHLRVLRERGAIGWTTLAPTTAPTLGAPSQPMGEARGPVAVLAAAAGTIDRRIRDSFLALGIDETPATTEAVLADHRRRYSAGAVTAEAAAAEAIIARHHALQRVLERHPVVIPFAERISFPARSIRHRQDHLHFLTLIEASALLHQRQRVREGDAICATEADFHIAVHLADGLLGTGGDGLSTMSRNLLQRVHAAGLATFGIPDLAVLLPDESPWTFHAALRELRDLGLTTAAVGRLPGGRHRLTAPAVALAQAPGITLRPVGSPGPEHRLYSVAPGLVSDVTPQAAAG